MDEELAQACAEFLESDQGVKVNKQTKYFEMSEIFKWYKDDFGDRLEHVGQKKENNLWKHTLEGK